MQELGKLRLVYALISLVGISTWIDINSVFVELPIIINSAPEQWKLPSIMSLLIQIGNIAPVAIVLYKTALQRHRYSWLNRLCSKIPFVKPSDETNDHNHVMNQVPLIYTIISVSAISSLVIAFAWQITHNQQSPVLLAMVFTLALVDTSSSICYMDYMKKFKTKFVNSMLLGESIGTILPPILALVQGVGEINCTRLNDSTLVPELIPPRFSVKVFFVIISTILLVSLIAFFVLQKHIDGRLALAKFNDSATENEHSTQELIIRPKDQIECKRLLLLSLPINCILFGILPALSSYSMMPYGHTVYYIGSVINPIASSIALIPKIVWPNIKLKLRVLSAIFLLGLIPVVLIITTSAMSPCPFLVGQTIGSIIVLLAWFLAQLTLSLIRIQIANTISQLDSTKLFWFGVTVQAGGFMGAVPLYVLSTKGYLKSGDQCGTSCPKRLML